MILSRAKAKNSIYPEDRSIPCYRLLKDNNEILSGLIDEQDKLYCEQIEMNECELHEFRCRNGFYIDHPYLFDGEADCLDLSDEQRFLLEEKYQRFSYCYERASIDCDEHWCSRDEISSGDGQCFAWHKLFWYAPSDTCQNHQSDLYKCSIHQNIHLNSIDQFIPTRNDGHCTNNIFDIHEVNSSCIGAIQCAVTHQTTCKLLGLYYEITEDALPRVRQECHGRKQIEYASDHRLFDGFYRLS